MVFADLVLSMWLPQPLHQLALSFCHLVYLLYSTKEVMETKLWRVVGKMHTLLHWPNADTSSLFLNPAVVALGQALTHALMERIEMGSTCTLYCHGLTHVWDLPRLPITLSDEAGEAALRVLKKREPTLSTTPDAAMHMQRRSC